MIECYYNAGAFNISCKFDKKVFPFNSLVVAITYSTGAEKCNYINSKTIAWYIYIIRLTTKLSLYTVNFKIHQTRNIYIARLK